MASRWHRAQMAFNQLVLVRSRFSFALCLGFFCGVVGVCVDLDHVTMFWGHPVGRVAHTPLLILAVLVLLYCGACIGGLLAGMVLKRRREKCDRPDCPTCGGKENSDG